MAAEKRSFDGFRLRDGENFRLTMAGGRVGGIAGLRTR
jgi:hypothetical protein